MLGRVLILCACLLGGSAYIGWAMRTGEIPSRASLNTLPMQIGAWNGREAGEFSDRIMSVLGVDDYVNRIYYDFSGKPVGLYIGYYLSQRQGDSIHSPLNCLPGSGWNPVKREYLDVPVGKQTIRVNRIVILKGTDKQIVLYWYQSHGHVVASEYTAKFYTVLDAMRTGRTDAALVRIVSPALSLDPAEEEEAGRRAVEFTQLVYPMLDRYIPE